ncbi:MAG TPA: hypothetical protein VJY33_15990 [Isosphaeraceae bacterium]|nr:hypothetical protein [Isosphaeraceae bacterium]
MIRKPEDLPVVVSRRVLPGRGVDAMMNQPWQARQVSPLHIGPFLWLDLVG